MATTQNDDGKKEIVIIGGGIIGCTSAYYLTRHPAYDASKHKITLLEASKIAGGASGKAGGLLALWAYPSSIVPLSYKLHKELAEEHGGEERWGYRRVHCGQVECVGRGISGGRGEKQSVKGKDGVMDGNGDEEGTNVSLQKRSRDAMNRLRAKGVPKDLDWVSPDALRAYEEMGDPSTTAQVHPYQFTTSMASLAREKGVQILENSPVTAINYTPDGSSVSSVSYTIPSSNTEPQTQTLPATNLIIASGPWTPHIYPTAPISALRAHSITIRPSRPVSAYALFTQIKLPSPFPLNPSHSGQIVTPEIYARPANEVYACGEGDHLAPLPPTSSDVQVDESRCQDIVDFVGSVSEELREGEVTARQACYLPSVQGSSAPLVGFTGVEGEVMAVGHTCWGIQNAPATGRLVSEFVFEGAGRSAKVKGLDPRNFL